MKPLSTAQWKARRSGLTGGMPELDHYQKKWKKLYQITILSQRDTRTVNEHNAKWAWSALLDHRKLLAVPSVLLLPMKRASATSSWISSCCGCLWTGKAINVPLSQDWGWVSNWSWLTSAADAAALTLAGGTPLQNDQAIAFVIKICRPYRDRPAVKFLVSNAMHETSFAPSSRQIWPLISDQILWMGYRYVPSRNKHANCLSWNSWRWTHATYWSSSPKEIFG